MPFGNFQPTPPPTSIIHGTYTHLSGKLFDHLFFYLWQSRAWYPSRQYLNWAQSFTERVFQLASWHTDVTCMSIGKVIYENVYIIWAWRFKWKSYWEDSSYRNWFCIL